MKRLMVLSGILFGGLSFTLGCSCLPDPPPKEAFAEADAVFSGKVESIRPQVGEPYFKVTLRVLQSWKGPNSETLIVSTPIDSPMCGYSFVKDQEYLVYARASGVNKTQWATGLCGRNSLLTDASEDLRFLGAGRKPAKK